MVKKPESTVSSAGVGVQKGCCQFVGFFFFKISDPISFHDFLNCLKSLCWIWKALSLRGRGREVKMSHSRDAREFARAMEERRWFTTELAWSSHVGSVCCLFSGWKASAERFLSRMVSIIARHDSWFHWTNLETDTVIFVVCSQFDDSVNVPCSFLWKSVWNFKTKALSLAAQNNTKNVAVLLFMYKEILWHLFHVLRNAFLSKPAIWVGSILNQYLSHWIGGITPIMPPWNSDAR